MVVARKSEYNRWFQIQVRSLSMFFVVQVGSIAVFQLLLLSILVRPAVAETKPNGEVDSEVTTESQTSIWEFNARMQPAHANADCLERMVVRHAVDNLWRASDLKEFERSGTDASGKPLRTVVYVHGNWTTAEEARQRGWLLYHRLKKRSDSPFRFVIYSWDSERHGAIAQDLKSKLNRIDTESYRLAKVLDSIPDPAPIGLVGYSFGGAVVCGALQLVSGSELAGMKVDSELPSEADVRVNFYAPAFDRGELAPYGKYGHAFEVVDKVVNVFNSKDPALKRFRFIAPKHSPVAAGYAGLVSYRNHVSTSNDREAEAPDIVQVDVAKQVGKTHSEMNYIQNSATFNYLLSNLVGL